MPPAGLDFDFAELDGDLAFADETVEQEIPDDIVGPSDAVNKLEVSLDDILGVAVEPAKPASDAATEFLAELSVKYNSGAKPEKSKPLVMPDVTVDPFAGVVDFDELAIDMDGFAPFESEQEKQPVSARIEHSPAEDKEDGGMLPMDDEGDMAFDALFDSVSSN